MRSIIIYFSLTGNTKKVAQAIHKGMSQPGKQCDIATVKEVDIRCLTDYDLIGLGSPIWGGAPPNVRRLIEAMPPLQGKHTLVFCTHGAWPERFFPPVLKRLAKKGLIVIGIRDWYGSVNRPALPKPYLTDGHPDEIDLKEAEHFGKEMVELSRRISAGEQSIPSLPKMRMLPLSKLPRPLPKLNSQECRYPKCRLCMDNCPVDAIDLSVSPPIFAKNCSICYFCEMICPEGAIEVDYDSRAKASLPRVKNIFVEVLEKAEAEGRFRRLVPLEDIDWHTPYYKVYSKHPRYVIPKEDGDSER
jgi:flavodoxin/Fe-S-cluster-containing hydrogenase component 2